MRVCQRCSSVYPTGTRFCGIDGQELKPFTEDPLLGKSIGRYKINALMGRGGCGSVYRAVHSELNSEFAIKVLYGNLGADARYVERFRREAQVVSKIRSPWVVSVVDFGTSETGLTYLVMEYCDGVGLDQLIAKEKTIAPARAARFTAQIASALSVAHKLGLVHRDVKPANVMVQVQEGKEFAKLLDFGIVRMPDAEDSEKLTQEGVVMGTPPYMAPEQASGSEVTAAADLYSLGVVLFQMLTGVKPFTGSAAEIFDKHRSHPPPPMPISGPLADLCYALLAKKPAQRPGSAALVQSQAKKIEHDLRKALGGSGSFDMTVEPGSMPAKPFEPTPSSTNMAPPTPSLPGMLIGRDPSALAPALARVPSAVTAPQPIALDASQALSAPAASKPLKLIVGGLVAVLAILIGVLVFTSRPEPVASVALPGPSTAELEQSLASVLSLRGLSMDDLATLNETQATYAEWQNEKRGSAGARPDTLAKLVDRTRAAIIPETLLTARLDKLDPMIAAQAQRMPADQFEALKVEYLDLYRQLGMATAQSERDVMAKAIVRFENTLNERAKTP